jgi:hypothetical protein
MAALADCDDVEQLETLLERVGERVADVHAVPLTE